MDVEVICDVFCSFGFVYICWMFGGKGIYYDELMFVLEVGGELYFKVDEEGVRIF